MTQRPHRKRASQRACDEKPASGYGEDGVGSYPSFATISRQGAGRQAIAPIENFSLFITHHWNLPVWPLIVVTGQRCHYWLRGTNLATAAGPLNTTGTATSVVAQRDSLPSELSTLTGLELEDVLNALDHLHRTDLAAPMPHTPGLGEGPWALTSHGRQVGPSLVKGDDFTGDDARATPLRLGLSLASG